MRTSLSLSLSLSFGWVCGDAAAQTPADSTWFLPLDRHAAAAHASTASTVQPVAGFRWHAAAASAAHAGNDSTDSTRRAEVFAGFDLSTAFRTGGGMGGRGVGAVGAEAAGKRWTASGTAEVWRWGGAVAPARTEAGRVAGLGRAWMRREGAAGLEAVRFVGRAAWTLSPSVQLEGGVHPHHWGAGWRSVWLDRAADPLPYLRASLGRDRVRYTHLIARTATDASTPKAGWLAAHSVDVDLGAGFTGSLFGAVRWLEADTGYRFRFPLAYAVPVVAFRPLEYAAGSADNALIGASLLWKQGVWTAYAQGALDEFLYREVRARSGWWGTKWAALVHVTRSGPDGGVLLEGVAVRPYTFSHVDPGTAWAHQGAPLGHPAGANFAELRAVGERRWGPWRLRASAVRRVQGEGPRIGADVAATYIDRPANYGITTVWIGGGAVPEARWVRTWIGAVDAARRLDRLGGQEAFVRAVAATEVGLVVECGLRTDRVWGDRTW